MTSSRIAAVAASAAAGAWTCKSIAIGVAGGLDRSPLESPLFLLGLVCAVVAATALGWTLTSGRAPALRTVGAFLVLVGMVGLGLLVDAGLSVLQPERPSRHWVFAELGLWVSVVTMLTVAVLVDRRALPATGRTHSPRSRAAG